MKKTRRTYETLRDAVDDFSGVNCGEFVGIEVKSKSNLDLYKDSSHWNLRKVAKIFNLRRADYSILYDFFFKISTEKSSV